MQVGPRRNVDHRPVVVLDKDAAALNLVQHHDVGVVAGLPLCSVEGTNNVIRLRDVADDRFGESRIEACALEPFHFARLVGFVYVASSMSRNWSAFNDTIGHAGSSMSPSHTSVTASKGPDGARGRWPRAGKFR